MATKLEGELPPAIEGLFADLQIQPSFLCRILFQWAAVLSTRKQEGINELSCTGVFLAATILPEEIFAPLLASNDRAWEAEAFLTFMDALSKDAEIKIDKIVDGYYSKSIADISIESIDISNVHHTSTLKQALVGWLRRTKSNDAVRTVGALDLIRAALENADAILQMRLRDVGLNSITIIDLIPSLGDFEPTREQKRGRRVVKKRNVKRDSRRTQGATQTESFTRDLRSRIDRDPDDPTQYALGIKVYTAALATILRTARSEFCFGLFGPWGIGKTRLVRHMTPLLESPDQYKAAMAERGYAVGSDGDDKLKYEVVWYSAWKFRRPPEAWIFLYENMATHAMAAGLWRKIGRIIRVGVAKHGFWPLVFGLLALGLAAVPLDSWLRLGGAIIAIIGFGGLTYGFGIFRRGRETVRSLVTRYATLTRHGERLGVQALIGSDLRALLLGWIPQTRHYKTSADRSLQEIRAHAFGNLPWLSALTILGVFAAIWAWAMLGAPAIPDQARTALIKGLCGGVMEENGFWCAPRDAGASEHWQYYFFVFVGWLVACAAVLRTVRVGGTGTDRILLVVDDLDRCSPTEVIEIAESLKLLLEDADIQNRVQILMLIDEGILEFAIQNKFNDVIADRAAKGISKGKNSARNDVINEHIEKLFACYLRLPSLSEKEIGEIARLYSEGDLQRRNAMRRKEIDYQIARLPPEPDQPQRGPVKDVMLVPLNAPPDYPLHHAVETERPALSNTGYKEQLETYIEQKAKIESEKTALLEERSRLADLAVKARSNGGQGREAAALAGSGLRFGKEEIALFTDKLPKIMQSGGRRPSPRAIRIFLFKYQLCHLLMQLSHDIPGFVSDDSKPDAIFPVLADACFGNSAKKLAPNNRSRAALQCIVSQVA